jgi:hypothetical protein
LRHGTDRGDRDEHDGGLTSGGGRRQRPDFEGQSRRVPCGLAQRRQCAAAKQGRRRRAARAGEQAQLGLTRARKVRRVFIGCEEEPRMPPGGGGAAWPASPGLWAAAGPPGPERSGRGRVGLSLMLGPIW